MKKKFSKKFKKKVTQHAAEVRVERPLINFLSPSLEMHSNLFRD